MKILIALAVGLVGISVALTSYMWGIVFGGHAFIECVNSGVDASCGALLMAVLFGGLKETKNG